uniref:Uncharacterized protein n=1 Tax=Branchiostoma floridae TaxID=7739 RepID=C3YNP7_BRAFL|eukprot:XP_002601995.1 hypothetical protein BRAFLDRAFT_82581 [Branchiostoma floridae]
MTKFPERNDRIPGEACPIQGGLKSPAAPGVDLGTDEWKRPSGWLAPTPRYSHLPTPGDKPPTPRYSHLPTPGDKPPTPRYSHLPTPGDKPPTPRYSHLPTPGGEPPTPRYNHLPTPGGEPPTPRYNHLPTPGDKSPTPLHSPSDPWCTRWELMSLSMPLGTQHGPTVPLSSSLRQNLCLCRGRFALPGPGDGAEGPSSPVACICAYANPRCRSGLAAFASQRRARGAQLRGGTVESSAASTITSELHHRNTDSQSAGGPRPGGGGGGRGCGGPHALTSCVRCKQTRRVHSNQHCGNDVWVVLAPFPGILLSRSYRAFPEGGNVTSVSIQAEPSGPCPEEATFMGTFSGKVRPLHANITVYKTAVRQTPLDAARARAAGRRPGFVQEGAEMTHLRSLRHRSAVAASGEGRFHILSNTRLDTSTHT